MKNLVCINLVLYFLFFCSCSMAGFDKNLLSKFGLNEDVISSVNKNDSFSLYIDGVYIGELNMSGKENNDDISNKIKNVYDLEIEPLDEIRISGNAQEVNVISSNDKIVNYWSGKAFLTNYNFQDSIIDGQHQLYGDIDSRLLMDGYALKTVGNLTSSSNEAASYETKELFLERKTNDSYEYQIGKLVTKNSNFSGIELIGLQFSPTKSKSNFETLEPIEGYVLSPSDLEVIQNGNVIYRARINAGHYEVNDLSIKSASNFILVRITEGNGKVIERNYSLIESIADSGKNDFSFSFGMTRNNDLLLLGSYGARYKNIPLQFGAAISQNNANIGLNATIFPIWDYLSLSAFSDLSFKEYQNVGMSYGATATYIKDKYSLSAGMVSYSDFYQIDNDEYATDYLTNTLSMGYQVSKKTSVNFSVTQNIPNRKNSSYTYFANINHDFKYIKSSLYLSKEEAVIRFSVPLDGHYFSSSLSVRDNVLTSSSNYTKSMLDNRGSISVGANMSENSQYFYTQGSYTGNTANFSAGAGVNKSGFYDVNSYNLGTSGSVVISNKGVDFSSSKSTDNIAIVDFNQHYDGVSVSTDRGTYYPSISGRVLISELDGYSSNKIKINSNELPENVSVIGGVDYITPSFGSKSDIKFNLNATIDGVHQLKFEDGTAVPQFMVVTSEKGKYITVVGPDGLIGFNRSRYTTGKYNVTQSGVNVCQFEIGEIVENDAMNVVTCL